MRADLHTHTTCSDGTDSPEELMESAVKAGLHALSITDHDTLKAYDFVREHTHPLVLIPGVELSTTLGPHSIHILAYSFSLNNRDMRALCDEQVKRREKRNEEILHRLELLGCAIEPEELYFTRSDQIGSIGRPHIAKVLVSKGFARSIRDAFDRYIGEGASAFAAGARCPVEEAIEIVHAAGGFVVIAHPHYIRDNSVLTELLKCPFDGLEAYYAHFTRDQVPYWLGIAKAHGLFVTGGSDFHGDIKPQHFLGASCTPLEVYTILSERAFANNV